MSTLRFNKVQIGDMKSQVAESMLSNMTDETKEKVAKMAEDIVNRKYVVQNAGQYLVLTESEYEKYLIYGRVK